MSRESTMDQNAISQETNLLLSVQLQQTHQLTNNLITHKSSESKFQPHETSPKDQQPVNTSINNDDEVISVNKPEIKKDITILPTNTKGLHTVFIHKLYSMLEDEELKHLIWWSPSNESFIITPGEEFSKALAQYFKHTNVASFIRQLNMYGFHKVSDGSNQNDGDVPTWEFRHSSGSFRKGDVDSLKSIKRRSSKHTSRNTGNTTTLTNTYYESDNEFVGSERSNSYVDLSSLNDANSGNSDPILNVRLAELGHNLASLRHEHARLQLRYDTAIEDLRKINMDMVYLLELVQKLIQSSTLNEKEQQISSELKRHEDELASPCSAPGQNEQAKYSLQDVEHDIARFRNTILQRTVVKDIDLYSSDTFAPSYHVNQQIPRFSYSAPQALTQPQPQLHAQAQVQVQVHPYAQPHAQPHAQPQPPLSQSGPSSPSDPNAPVPYPYPYPYPPPPQSSLLLPSQQTYYQQPGQHTHHHHNHQIVRNPFEKDHKSSTSSSSKGRHMSILYDPLSTGPSLNNTSPSASIHRGSNSGPTSNPDTHQSTNGGYFSDYHQHHTQSPDINYKQTLIPSHQTTTATTATTAPPAPAPAPPAPAIPQPQSQSQPTTTITTTSSCSTSSRQPVTRDQRHCTSLSGLIIPSVQHLRPDFQRKRHSVNDVMFDNYNNPPRSVPDHQSPVSPELKASNFSKGVHSLLNPVERRDSISDLRISPNKKMKK